MKRLLLLFVILLCPAASYAAGDTWGEQTTPPPKVTVKVPVKVDVAPAATEPTLASIADKVSKTISERRKERRERRAMGLTVVNVSRVLASMVKSGEITEDMDPSDMTLLVMPKLIEENPEAFAEVKFDFEKWEKILGYLYELILFIIQIFALF